MYIKPHSTRNEYIRAGGVWVRNFTKDGVVALSLDHLYETADYEIVLANEAANRNYTRISRDLLNVSRVVIVSDGYNFNWKHLSIAKFPRVAVLTVNRAMKKWKLMSPRLELEERRGINAYVVNNPYRECMGYLPTEIPYFPACVASSRTNSQFLKRYLGNIYVYEPPPDNKFGVERKDSYSIDDYRNPICAAIGLAYQWGVRKLMLISCDDSFAKERDFAVPLPNGLWTYPQQIRSHEIIDANLFWLKHQDQREIEVADWSDGPKYVNATYISNEEEAIGFFVEEDA